MKAEDVKPNRIERAKIDARELIHLLRGDRGGLILFAGDAFVQCPLTTDYDAILSLINTIDLDSTVTAGTSLAAPMEVALKSLKPEDDKYALLLLLTDGEDTVGGIEKSIKELRRRGIKVFTIGIGKKEGVPIPLFDVNGNRVGYKKDKQGKVVITMLDEETLEWVSETTGGFYFRAGENFDEIKRFKSTLDNLMKREFETKKFTVYEERYQVPLVIGLIFVGAFILRTTRLQRRMV
jgi:Ca-activated chloride channel family protein